MVLFVTLSVCFPQIQFLLGADSEPWTWVMGEHGEDLPYDELVRQRERREREKEEEEEREIQSQAEKFAKLETGHIMSLASEKNNATTCIAMGLRELRLVCISG